MSKLFIAAIVAIAATCIFGWGVNIYSLAQMDWDNLGVEALLRIIGIPVAPIGVIMGLFV